MQIRSSEWMYEQQNKLENEIHATVKVKKIKEFSINKRSQACQCSFKRTTLFQILTQAKSRYVKWGSRTAIKCKWLWTYCIYIYTAKALGNIFAFSRRKQNIDTAFS